MPREHGEEDGEVDVLGAEPEDAGVLHGPHHPRLLSRGATGQARRTMKRYGHEEQSLDS